MKLGYRPEIDGLRAVAVLIVIFNHLGWSLFSGGYVGVDVFFVISGFLITRILVDEIGEGKLSIVGFYKRRIVRLAPAYFLVLAATSAIALCIMLPADLLDYAKSVLYSTVFLANFYMWKEVGGYFNNQVEFIPLLHLWSLAVEEQFYIFWPLILWLIHKLLPPRWLAWVVFAGLLAGIGLAEWGTLKNPDLAYYLMPTRAFELAMGAMLVFLPAARAGATLARALPAVGLLMILYPALSYGSATPFPGLHAILPCAGSALLIHCADRRHEWVGRLLSSAPMNFVGRISYPAYLWHWPLIAALNICKVPLSAPVAAAVLAATLLLSHLTFRYVEQPAKRLHAVSFGRLLGLGYLLPTAACAALAVLAMQGQGWPGRFTPEVNLRSAALHTRADKIRRNCFEGDPAAPGGAERCVLGKNKPGVDILLIGDSHANHFSGMIDVMARDAGLRGYDITQSNTIYLPGVRRYFDQKGRRLEHREFSTRNNYIETLLRTKHFQYVVMGGSFVKHFNQGDWGEDGKPEASARTAFKDGFEKAVREIGASGAIPVVIKGNPRIVDGVQRCTLENALGRSRADCDSPTAEYLAMFKDWSAYLDELARRYPKLLVIDPARVICDQRNCHTELNNTPLYLDEGHLNYRGSELVGELYLARFGNPFAPGGNTLSGRN